MGKGEAKEVRKKGAIKERENASFFVAPDSRKWACIMRHSIRLAAP